MIGETLAHYRILERLGEGGMGEVYLAQDLKLQRPVAIKVLNESCCGEEAMARLLHEARAASALAHPAIAVVYEVDQAELGGRTIGYLAMEYVAGRPLDLWARDTRPDLDAMLAIAAEIVDGLAAAHEGGVIHRDLKPSNILVTSAARAKILDFGVAQRTALAGAPTMSGSAADLERAGIIAGTAAYMSPEQALGDEVDARSDVFSLGVVFYELLSGTRPFDGRTAIEVLDRVLHADPAPLSRRSGATSDGRLGALERIVFRMLAKAREARYPDVREIARDLAAARSGAATESFAAPPAAPAVAVLGFANLTGHSEDGWLDAGLAESVVADIKALGFLSVVGEDRIEEARRRIGASAEAGEAAALRVAREVGARWAIVGAFQRSGDSVRVTARVLEVGSGVVSGGVKVDGSVEHVFALQDRVAAALAGTFRSGGAGVAPVHEETRSVEAYEAVTRGVVILRAETYESLDRAILFFERATALDPSYARAWTELGAATATKADYLTAPEVRARAIAALRRATELKPESPFAWRELGLALAASGRDDEGLAASSRALALAPEEAAVLGGYGRILFLGPARFAEAADYFARAVASNPHAGWFWLLLAHSRTLLRELDRADAAADHAIELQEASLSGRHGARIVGAYMRRGHVASLRGRFRDALKAFEEELAFLARVDHALRSRIAVELHLRRGGALLGLGESERGGVELRLAIEQFDQRVAFGADDPFTRFYAAGAFALQGDAPRALELLEKCVAERPAYTIARAAIEPEFEGLRSDPRFRLLVGA